MKIIFLTMILLLSSPFSSKGNELNMSETLSEFLNKLIKEPEKEIPISFYSAKYQVNSEDEAEKICEALKIIKNKFTSSKIKSLDNSLFCLISLFKNVSSYNAISYLNDNGIPLICDLLDTISSFSYDNASFKSDLSILQILALSPSENGFQYISKYILKDYKSNSYFWMGIFEIVSHDKNRSQFLVDNLKGHLPINFLGITYLDFCNDIRRNGYIEHHPFNNDKGFQFILNVLENLSDDNQSYLLSLIDAIPFIEKKYSDTILHFSKNSKNVNVKISIARAGATLGIAEYKNQLINFANDYRYHELVIEYLKELNLENLLSEITYSNDFKALSEMCSWLSHPSEYGTYPDVAEIIFKSEIYWPPTKDRRVIYLIKFKYPDDGSDFSEGIGLVGSITFAFGDTKNKSIIEMLAYHCLWELGNTDIKDLRYGIDLLKKNNHDLK